jgi:hypothetical protein
MESKDNRSLRLVDRKYLPFLTSFVLQMTLTVAHAEPARGPLRILQSNPRYFTDGSGKAIYLTGTHNWNNFQNTGHRAGPGDPPPVLDYTAFLDFVQAHNHNFFRLWRWESPKWTDDEPRGVAYARPHPWLRTGPGNAKDDKPTHNELASVRYCLAKPGSEYLVFQPGSRGEFTVDLGESPLTFSVEWLNVNTGSNVTGKPVRGGGVTIFSTPFGGPAVLYLKAMRVDCENPRARQLP